MTGRIEHWERKYRVRHAAVVGRLDALTGPVLAAYEEAVRAALPDPDEVVLVRDLHVRLVLTSSNDAEAELARAWGRAMATAVLRALAEPDSHGIARFPDRAAHLAAFVAAAAHGQPTDHWTFARFAAARRSTARDTIAAALLAHPVLAPAAIRRLHLSGHLPRVVGVLGPFARRVWSETLAGTSPLSAAERPLFAAAIALVARLGGRSPRRLPRRGSPSLPSVRSRRPTGRTAPTSPRQSRLPFGSFLVARRYRRHQPQTKLQWPLRHSIGSI